MLILPFYLWLLDALFHRVSQSLWILRIEALKTSLTSANYVHGHYSPLAIYVQQQSSVPVQDVDIVEWKKDRVVRSFIMGFKGTLWIDHKYCRYMKQYVIFCVNKTQGQLFPPSTIRSKLQYQSLFAMSKQR